MSVAEKRPTTFDRPSSRPFQGKPRRRTVNITWSERIARVVIGLATAVLGVVLVTSASTWLALVLEVLLIGAGLDLIVTGSLGHCPLYAKLGHVPNSLKSSS